MNVFRNSFHRNIFSIDLAKHKLGPQFCSAKLPTSTTSNIYCKQLKQYSQRENKRSAKLIVSLVNNKTLLLKHPEDDENVKQFAFDCIYWSHNGFTEASNGLLVADPSHPNGKIYTDQQTLYEHLAVPLLNNAWQGYNVSLFAYGQTGSGKSFTMIGHGANKGIVPRVCEHLFQTIENRKSLNINVEVSLSMLELYSEIVRDLLEVDTNTRDKKKGLKIREHPTKGFFAENLQSFLVTSYDEIYEKIEQGVTNRSISATNMNEVSSRSHMILVINVTQRSQNASGQEETKTSVINLVDLAGSERLSDIDGGRNSVSGDRFKESIAINQSLSCLGNCIHALAEKALGKNVKVPYRESVLTRLLMNSLGGNSKTAMIANISPADVNFDETLSTLRYADRAKQIQNFAKINLDSTERIIRDLKDENEKLKKLLEQGALPTSGPASRMAYYDETKSKLEEEVEAIMKENDRKMNELRQSYEDRLVQEKKAHLLIEMEETKRKQLEKEKENCPHLSNLNFDEQLVDKIIFLIKPGVNTVGKNEECHIQLMGPSIQENHAIITRTDQNKVILERGNEDCRLLLNGHLVTHRVNLTHNDRILFGISQLFVFKNPLDPASSTNQNSIVTYEQAQEEIASNAGYNLNNEDNSVEQALLIQELLELIPAVDEANAISDELEKMVHFDIILVSPIFLGKIGRKPEPYVKVNNSHTGQEFEWTKEKFFDRLYLMKEMYHNYETGEEEWDLPFQQDPFMEDLEMECLIGTSQLYLQPLAYMVEVKEQLAITNYCGQEIGIINAEVVPCNEQGIEYEEQDNVYVDSPQELLGKPLFLMVKVSACRGLPAKFTDIYVKYKIFVDEQYSMSEKVATPINPNFNFRKLFHFTHVTQQLIDYLKEGIFHIEIWGRQLLKSGYSISKTFNIEKEPTKQMLQEELAKHGYELMNGFKMNGRVIDPNKQSIIVELLLMKKEQARMHQRMDNIKKLIDIAEKQKRRFIPVNVLKELIFTTTSESAESILSQILNDEQYPTMKDITNSATCAIS